MDAFISQINCGTWIKQYNILLVTWMDLNRSSMYTREIQREREGGREIERGREGGGRDRKREREMEKRRGGRGERETYDYQLLLCTPSLSYD